MYVYSLSFLTTSFLKWSYGGVDEDPIQVQEEGLLDPEGGDITLLWNVYNYFPVDTAPHTIRRKSLYKIRLLGLLQYLLFAQLFEYHRGLKFTSSGIYVARPWLVGRQDVANVREMRIAMQEEEQLALSLRTDELPGPDLVSPSGKPPSCIANYAERSLSLGKDSLTYAQGCYLPASLWLIIVLVHETFATGPSPVSCMWLHSATLNSEW